MQPFHPSSSVHSSDSSSILHLCHRSTLDASFLLLFFEPHWKILPLSYLRRNFSSRPKPCRKVSSISFSWRNVFLLVILSPSVFVFAQQRTSSRSLVRRSE